MTPDIREKVKESFRNWETKEEKVFNKTLAEVGKILNEEIKYWEMEWNNGRKHKDKELMERARVIIQNLKELKQKLGIK